MLYPKRAPGRNGWVLFLSFFIYFARLVAIISGDQTARTVEGIVLRSFRTACGNGLPYIMVRSSLSPHKRG